MTSFAGLKFKSFLNKIEPVKGIAFFLSLFLFFELVWKLCVHTIDGTQLIVLGKDLTHLVYPLCRLDAEIVYWITRNMLGYTNFYIDDTVVYFAGSLKMEVIWSCTSLKQYLMFVFIMALYFGPWKKKLKFVPLSLLFLSFVNIIRLVLSSYLLKDGFPSWFIPVNEILNGAKWEENSTAAYWQFYRDWFHFYHDGFFKWIYYDGIMFLLWLLWQEKFNLPYQRMKQQKQ